MILLQFTLYMPTIPNFCSVRVTQAYPQLLSIYQVMIGKKLPEAVYSHFKNNEIFSKL